MTFTMALDGLKKILDAPLLARMIRNSGFHEADIMELEFQVYGEEKLLSELKQNNIHCGCLIFTFSRNLLRMELKKPSDWQKEQERNT